MTERLSASTLMIDALIVTNEGLMMTDTNTLDERRKKMIHRLHRLQGQLSALERRIEEGASCEDTVVQARAIEKAIASMIVFVVDGFIEDAREQMVRDPDQTSREIRRLVELIHQ